VSPSLVGGRAGGPVILFVSRLWASGARAGGGSGRGETVRTGWVVLGWGCCGLFGGGGVWGWGGCVCCFFLFFEAAFGGGVWEGFGWGGS